MSEALANLSLLTLEADHLSSTVKYLGKACNGGRLIHYNFNVSKNTIYKHTDSFMIYRIFCYYLQEACVYHQLKCFGLIFIVDQTYSALQPH